jgi:dTDP-alpha-D-glucose dehydrogenase
VPLLRPVEAGRLSMGEWMNSVAIVGFGYVGSVIGACLAERGNRVTAIDVSEELVSTTNAGKTDIFEPELGGLIELARRKGLLEATRDFSAVAKASHIIVTVGTPLNSKLEADLQYLHAAAEEIGKHLAPGTVVMLKSTVVPHITRDLFGATLSKISGLKVGEEFFLAFSPERIAEGRAVSEFRSFPIVVGADDPESLSRAAGFWEKTLGVKTIRLHSSVGAEIVKLADNVWIDLNIAFANELSKVCHTFGADFDEVSGAASTLPKGRHYVNILQSSIGVGGSCLTKDPYFFAKLVDEAGGNGHFIRAARSVNDGMPAYTVSLIEDWLKKREKGNAKVAVFGLAFKSDTNDLRFTPVKPFLHQLRKTGVSISLYDPLVTNAQCQTMFDLVAETTPEDALRDADVLCFACAHHQFREYEMSWLASLTGSPCLFIDGRHSFAGDAAIAAGFQYVAV